MTLRDEAWLQELLDTVWDTYFADVPQDNDVRIIFGRRAKRRLGSISLDPKDRSTTVITMNGLFKSEKVPEYVILATLIHELTHYAHGFNSPLVRAQAHPHAGGVMRREFDERGALALYQEQKKWLKNNWAGLLQREMPNKTNNKTSEVFALPKPFWFIGRD
jgi:hypothetical protein